MLSATWKQSSEGVCKYFEGCYISHFFCFYADMIPLRKYRNYQCLEVIKLEKGLLRTVLRIYIVKEFIAITILY